MKELREAIEKKQFAKAKELMQAMVPEQMQGQGRYSATRQCFFKDLAKLCELTKDAEGARRYGAWACFERGKREAQERRHAEAFELFREACDVVESAYLFRFAAMALLETGDRANAELYAARAKCVNEKEFTYGSYDYTVNAFHLAPFACMGALEIVDIAIWCNGWGRRTWGALAMKYAYGKATGRPEFASVLPLIAAECKTTL